MERVVELGGVPVLLGAADDRRAAAMDHVFGELPGARHTPEVEFRYLTERPEPPARPPDVRTAQIQLWFDGTEVFAMEPSGLSGAAADREVRVGGLTADVVGGLDRLFLELITHVLYPLGIFVVHAGGVGRGDQSWLLLGGSGMGKSTLAFAAGGTGWTVHADDMAIVRRRGSAG